MTIRKRPELDTVNPPGQVRNDRTLGEYLSHKTESKSVQKRLAIQMKKLTFNEWWVNWWKYDVITQTWSPVEIAEAAFIAGQENK